MPRILAIMALIVLVLPCYGGERKIRIPRACRELAERSGVPLWLTLAQAKRAIAYVNVMNSRDPAVVLCRLALRKIRIK